MKKLKLEKLLEGLEDRRRENIVMYPLYEVLFIMIISILCGATGYVKIEMFGKSRQEWFSKYLKLENGIPDALTYRRILMMISPEKMHEIFTEWMKTVICNLNGVVAIDGKQSRRTGDESKKPLHVVSAFAHEFGVVLGQIACEEKSNEITAIPKLLDMLEISGCIVTIDAMGTQKEIAEKIISKEADYILALKENQKNMYNEVKLFLDDIRKDEDVINSSDYHKTVDKGHGRIEVRECVISYETNWLTNKSDWTGLNGIGAVYSTVEENGNISKQSHYFIFSCKNMTANQIMTAKRAHWGIENSLHWVLDLSFREDESRVRKGDSAENFNILRQIVYNILKSDTSFKDSFPNKQFRCLLDSSYLDLIVNSWLCS